MDNFSSLEEVEMPLPSKSFRIVAGVVFLTALIVGARIFFLNVKNGDFYQRRAWANMSDGSIVPAQRGIFFDRFDKPLAKNIPSFQAILKISDFLKNDASRQEEALKNLETVLNLSDGQIQEWLDNINLEKQSSLVLARDLTIEQMAAIKNLQYPFVEVQNDFLRQYEGEGALSHILGYTGLVSSDDLAENSDFSLNDSIGKNGLEFFYDKELRGKNGEKFEYKNAKNETLGQDFSLQAKNGNDLHLTIDKDLQEFFYGKMSEQLKFLGRTSGAGIVINPQSGEVLALVSFPSFDANHLTKDILSDSNQPLFNRAISGLYNPASTIKPLVGTAALTENVIDTKKSVFSAGYIDIPNPYHPDQPSRFVDWKPNGWINIYSALAKSSNIYFYSVGGGYGDIKGLGIEKLRGYWEKFGLNEKTGVDLPNEKSGFLPSPEIKQKNTGEPWRLGDTYNVSIGQGDLMITPMELISYISSVSTKGIFYKPFIVKKIVDEQGNVIKENNPQVIRDISYLKSAMGEVEKGMIDVSEKDYGTAYFLHDLPFIVASKTGSAQIQDNTKINAFYAGYGPLDPQYGNRQIAVLVLVENAKGGSLNAVPVAKAVFQWYYDNRLTAKVGH